MLNRHDQSNFGYLKVTVNESRLSIAFQPVTPLKTGVDIVTVDLAAHTVQSTAAKRPAKRTAAGAPAARKKSSRKGG